MVERRGTIKTKKLTWRRFDSCRSDYVSGIRREPVQPLIPQDAQKRIVDAQCGAARIVPGSPADHVWISSRKVISWRYSITVSAVAFEANSTGSIPVTAVQFEGSNPGSPVTCNGCGNRV